MLFVKRHVHLSKVSHNYFVRHTSEINVVLLTSTHLVMNCYSFFSVAVPLKSAGLVECHLMV